MIWRLMLKVGTSCYSIVSGSKTTMIETFPPKTSKDTHTTRERSMSVGRWHNWKETKAARMMSVVAILLQKALLICTSNINIMAAIKPNVRSWPKNLSWLKPKDSISQICSLSICPLESLNKLPSRSKSLTILKSAIMT